MILPPHSGQSQILFRWNHISAVFFVARGHLVAVFSLSVVKMIWLQLCLQILEKLFADVRVIGKGWIIIYESWTMIQSLWFIYESYKEVPDNIVTHRLWVIGNDWSEPTLKIVDISNCVGSICWKCKCQYWF